MDDWNHAKQKYIIQGFTSIAHRSHRAVLSYERLRTFQHYPTDNEESNKERQSSPEVVTTHADVGTATTAKVF